MAIIVAGGKGRRFGAGISKQFLRMGDKPVLAHTLKVFDDSDIIDSIIVVSNPDDIEYCQEEVVKRFGFKKVTWVVAGGIERQDSVRSGLDNVNESYDVTVIHDGVRPFVTRSIIERAVTAAMEDGASIVCVPAKDTIKEVSKDYVLKTLERKKLWLVQTPQAFKTGIIKMAHRIALEDGIRATDDSSLVERLGVRVKVVEGSYENIKITTPEDLAIGEAILQKIEIRD